MIDISNYLGSLLAAFWIMLPAYLPNPAAVVGGGGTPIDLGRRFPDGRRILGDGKTFRGFFIGVAAGMAVGVLQIALQEGFPSLPVPAHTYASIFLLAVGALTGDAVKSFFKRRVGKERGAKWPIADQYDLVAGALLFLAVFDLPWFLAEITLPRFILILLITPILHRLVNLVGYAARLKDVPW
jgi:CDP-2,3-bis-(O-geranylgeranyl)-sn-glycerol synthase